MEAEPFRGRKVLITGGAGMLGSSIAHRLVELGARVTVLDAMFPQFGGNAFNLSGIEDRIRFVTGDIRDEKLLLQEVAHAELIFNLAAQVSYIDSNIKIEDDLEINCRGQIRLLEACRQTGGRQKVLFASSRFVYGRIEYNPVDERHPLNCLSIYGIHKIAGEKYHRFFYERYGLRTVSLRIANPFGPRQQMKHSRYGIVNWFVRLALEGKPLTVYGNGDQRRDYIYVEDLTEAFLQLSLSDRTDGEVYNVGSGVGIPFRQMAEQIAEAVPGTRVVETEWNPNSTFVETGDYVSDIRKICQHTGWTPKVSLREGIQRSLEYYRHYRDHYWTGEEVTSPVPSTIR